MEQKTNIDVKRTNQVSVYRKILKHDRITIQQLSQSLGMSVPTVTKNINELILQGLVKESGEYDSTGGRRPKTVSPIKTTKVAVGLDITQNHISIVAVDLCGNVLNFKRLRKIFVNEAQYYSEVAALVNSFIDENHFRKQTVLGVGIAIPGIVSADGMVIMGSGVLKIRGEHVDNPFAGQFEYENSMLNEANAAGFIEWFGSNEVKDMVYLSLSNSVGGAIIIDGQLFPGDTQRSAEFGHVITHKDGKCCYCGKKGCYDFYGKAVLLSDLADGSIDTFFKQLRRGNVLFQKTFDVYLNDLAFLVGNLRTQFDCPIVLGGYVGSYLDEYLDEVKKRVSAYTLKETGYLKTCKYKIEASAAGAAMQYIYRFITNLNRVFPN